MGISIGIEGNEGGGKSLLQQLTGILIKQTTDWPIMAVREPGGSDLGNELRIILRDEKFKGINGVASTLLYSAARAELFFNSETPFLQENPNGILLKDRTWLSTFCLQSVDGANMNYIRSVQEPFLSIPDKFMIIDIPVEETVARLTATYRTLNNGREPDWRDQQSPQILQQIRDNYLSFVVQNRDKCTVLDCFDEPSKKAALIKLDIVKTLAEREDKQMSLIDENLLLNQFEEEARHIVESNETRVFSGPEAPYAKTFDITRYREEVEKVRIELNLPSREALRFQMHNEWRKLGIENGMGNRERELR